MGFRSALPVNQLPLSCECPGLRIRRRLFYLNPGKLERTFRNSVRGIAEHEVRRSKGALQGYRLRNGVDGDQFVLEFLDVNGDVVRVKRLSLEKRIVA